MSVAQLRASRAVWLRRERFRRTRWAFYKHRSHRSAADRLRLREKWWGLYEQARTERVKRDRQLQAAKPKPSVRTLSDDYAKSFVGVSESPAGSNRGPHITEWELEIFGSTGIPWCGVFAGHVLKWAGVQGVTSRMASVAAIEDDARAHRAPFRGWTDNPQSAQHGDLAVIGGYGDHVARVLVVNPDGSCETVEGNTSPGSSGSQFNGGCVATRHRSKAEIRGFTLVDYPG
jgi:hypothetical protein